MCGLVGVAGLFNGKEEKALKELLIVDSLRGVDSTGLAVVPRQAGEARITKDLGDPFQLMDTKGFENLFKGMNRVAIGHNRYGTMGKAIRANAHPFEFDTLIGAHNGTLKSKWKIPDGQKYDVDSQALYAHMDKEGVKDLMQYMEGAWALVWWDKVEETINFLRNKERTLYLAYANDDKCVFWASERWMLEGVLARNDIKYTEPYLLGEDVHLSIAIGMDGKMEKPRAIMCPSTYTPVYTYHVQQQQNKYLPPVTSTPVKSPEAKKAGVTPSSSKVVQIGSKNGLAGSKQVLLEVLSKVDKDEHGSSYLSCASPVFPYANLRWYYGRSIDPDEAIGEEIVADIHDNRVEVGSQATYYKVVHSSVKFVEPVEEVVIEPEEYEDSRGRKLSYNDWVNKHGECAWCSDVVLPTDKHAFNSGGQVFCSSCVDNKDVSQFFTKLVSSKVH